MPALSAEELELMEKDRTENPGCFYSTALSQSCRSINGDSKCEILKKIFRQCPGQPKELISNRKEITEDEHSGESSSADDFMNRERMDRSGDSGFESFFRSSKQRDDDFEAQLSPFDFLRQEMLRPFEGFFGGGVFGGGPGIFEGMEQEFERMPTQPPPAFSRRPSNAPATPPHPPHYSFHPSRDAHPTKDAKKRADEQHDLFEGYSGRVEEI